MLLHQVILLFIFFKVNISFWRHLITTENQFILCTFDHTYMENVHYNHHNNKIVIIVIIFILEN